MKFKSEEIHFQQIEELQKMLREGGRPFSLKKKSVSNTLRDGAYKKNARTLDLGAMNQILEFNAEERWIRVEPRITFKELCRATLPFNLVPPVVPEFTTITLGGAIMGAALESSSHRFGQVNDVCLAYELLLGNGERIITSPEQNSDLFYAIPGSYGTLALLTAVKLSLVPAKKWVNLSYHRYKESDEALAFLSTPNHADFLEGIVFSPEKTVVVSAKMTDEPSYPLYKQKRYWAKWYAQHLENTKNSFESMRLEEYLFRLDRGAFWVGRYVNSFRTFIRLLFHIGIPKLRNNTINPSLLFRLFFGWACGSEKLYKIWHRIPNQISETLFFIHDFYTPIAKVSSALKMFMKRTGIFPIWLCPIQGSQKEQFLSPNHADCNFINIGLYGIPSSSVSTRELSAELEKEIVALGGRKMLYSFTYYDHDQFSNIYFGEKYDLLRKKYFAQQAFPTLYDKVTNAING